MSTITTIAASDLITNSRSDINTNFSNLNTDKIETSVIDTDTSLAANSDSKIPSQKAIKTYVDSASGSADWTQLGETVLSSGNIAVSVSSFSARKDLRFILSVAGTTTGVSVLMTFNADSAGNYGVTYFRQVNNGAVDNLAKNNAQSGVSLTMGNFTAGFRGLFDGSIANDSTGVRKVGYWSCVSHAAAGTNAPEGMSQGSFAWNNTTAQITTITCTLNAGTFDAGTRLTIYGKKD